MEEGETPLAGFDATPVAHDLAHRVLTAAVFEATGVPADAHVKTTQTRLLCILVVHAASILGRLTLLHGRHHGGVVLGKCCKPRISSVT